ncbi:MAG: arylesterase [Bryobacteraceae bacterium]
MTRLQAILLAAALLLLGCGRDRQTPEAASPAPATPEQVDTRQVIVSFGDSLTEGYGVEPGHSYPDYLQQELDRRGYPYRVVNAGISGDTTTGGLVRVSQVVELRPRLVILALGANDGLRGIPVSASQANLDQIIVTLRKAGAEVVLAGMTLPPNYGPDYIRSFEQMFTTLAARHKLPLIPFLLAGVAGTAEYMQNDGLHPNAEGCRRVAQTVFQTLEPLLRAQQRGR